MFVVFSVQNYDALTEWAILNNNEIEGFRILIIDEELCADSSVSFGSRMDTFNKLQISKVHLAMHLWLWSLAFGQKRT